MKRILIVGATSAIAQATSRRFAAQRASIYLIGRNPNKLRAVAADLKVRGATDVGTIVADLNDFHLHESLVHQAIEHMGGLDIVLVAHGTSRNQKACELSYEVTEQQLRINFLSVVSLLTPIANYFEAQGHGCIAVISSVAGERGRQSNYVYGTAKGAVKIFLQGLRNRLYHSGVSVLTVNPGFVDTPMTAELPKNFLFATPTSVGNGIYKAIIRSKDIVYLPWFWRWIMMGLKLVPEGIFKRMRV